MPTSPAAMPKPLPHQRGKTKAPAALLMPALRAPWPAPKPQVRQPTLERPKPTKRHPYDGDME